MVGHRKSTRPSKGRRGATKANSKQPLSRRDRILNAAEGLFARHGFARVTARQVAAAAKVDLALANYHFGRKQDLFEAVLARRAEEFNQERLAALDECERRLVTEAVTVQDVIEAYIGPYLRRSLTGNRGWRDYFRLVAHLNTSPGWAQTVIRDSFNPPVRKLVAVLHKVRPEASETELYWWYHLVSGALTLTFAQTGRLEELSEGLCKTSDLLMLAKRFVLFAVAGLDAVCSNRANSVDDALAQFSAHAMDKLDGHLLAGATSMR